MPLMPGRSKKAFSKNVETEMSEGKPQKQSLAIAYGMKRRNKKASGGSVKSGSSDMNYAKGGMVNESAKTEHRPMPEERDNDSKQVSKNSGNKPPKDDQWLDQPTVKQAQMNNSRKVMPMKHPKMASSDIVQVRLRDEEDHLQESAKVNEGPQEQPPKHDDEEGADRQGPDTPALHMKKMFEGGAVSEEASEEDNAEHPAGLEEDDQMRPSKDEYMADHFASGGSVESGSPDMNYADGGSVDEEAEIEHAASIAAAIMAQRKYARGGEILSEDSMETFEDEDQADLERNAEEDANMEDKASFDALRKENYSESDALEEASHPEDSNLHGDEREDSSENKHDSRLVDAIRRKMRKSPISR